MAYPLVFLDLETTGTRTTRDRITEIAALRVEQGRIVGRWAQLIQPGMRIPAQIVSLTGIDDAMVAEAPSFAAIAPSFQEWLGDACLVAHNARFDYGFLRNEFQRAGIDFRARVICTLRLSRRLNPDQAHHNLDALLERHELSNQARHRAEGDARALFALWQRWGTHYPVDRIEAEVSRQFSQPSLPAHLDPGLIQSIPGKPGVYLFYGENDLPLYIGKSVNLRARVMSHFQSDYRHDREMRLVRRIQRIDWRETVGDLEAQLLEARLVKELLPTMNRQLRRRGELMGWRWPEGDLSPTLVSGGAMTGPQASELFGLFRSRKEARRALEQIAADQGLCRRVLGIEAGRGRCFASQLGKCQGACHGAESLDEHERRARDALARLQVKSWPWEGRVAIGETNDDGHERWHLVAHWSYLGSVSCLEEASTLDGTDNRFDVDTYRILRRCLDDPYASRLRIVPA
ncbi:DNA polymerase III subunit epsilon [Halomonas sp. TRM85114]|nr:DNA polymerase III subunit epsilon [Halomonas jincaotanensis]